MAETSLRSVELFKELTKEWRNEGHEMGPELLQYLSDTIAPEGKVLECGCGLSTLVMGRQAKLLGAKVISLEHESEWIERLTPILSRYDLLPHVTLLLRPLVRIDPGWWYDLEGGEPIPPQLDLVVCDGPPGKYPGARMAAMTRLDSWIDARTTIVVDDCHRPEESELLTSWAARLGRPAEVRGPDRLGRLWGIIPAAISAAHADR